MQQTHINKGLSVKDMEKQMEKILEIKDLKVNIKIEEGILTPVRGINVSVAKGETLGIVGESGCGKSLTSKAILGINDRKCKSEGSIVFHTAKKEPIDLLNLPPKGKQIRKIRGKEISMIFQEPMVAFSPMYTIGNQINECTRLHITKDKIKSREISLKMMERVGIANPENRYHQYPHEFSGGMLQRALIAMALVCNPRLLIADEPTTALDVTIQAQILELMKELQKEMGMAIIFITHDLGTVAQMCDRVAVMYLGKIVETAPVDKIFESPRHPYTRGLIGSVHKIGTAKKERLFSIEGCVPPAFNLPERCGFYERCSSRIEGICDCKDPSLKRLEEGHEAACFACAEREKEER